MFVRASELRAGDVLHRGRLSGAVAPKGAPATLGGTLEVSF